VVGIFLLFETGGRLLHGGRYNPRLVCGQNNFFVFFEKRC